ncbi:class C sortase [Leucobacter chinensis]|uniref:class C sortase n=1 Tax=Leucobacter chinensis TaxID=2851010 RepID=UPI001C2153EF
MKNAPDQSATEPSTAQRRKAGASTWVTIVCWIVGVTILLYPTASAWLSQYNQSSVTGDYATELDGVSPEREVQLRNAHAYNEALSAGAILSAGGHIPMGAGEARESGASPYSEQLKTPSGMMSRLRIPAIDVDLPIYHGTDEDTLLKGLGHLEGTSLPVGGESTRSVITGHRGLASARMFTDLDKIEKGDVFTLETFGEVLHYEVNEVQVVAPEDTETLHQVAGEDLVTLITCTPLGVNTHRILVTGERVAPTPQTVIDEAGKQSDLPGFPWWAVAVIGSLGLAIAYYRMSTRPRKSRQ